MDRVFFSHENSAIIFIIVRSVERKDWAYLIHSNRLFILNYLTPAEILLN